MVFRFDVADILRLLVLQLLVVTVRTYHAHSQSTISWRKASSGSSLSTGLLQAYSSKLDDAGGIMYQTSFLSKEDFHKLKQEYDRLKSGLHPEISTSIAQKRLGVSIPPQSTAMDLFASPSRRILQWVQRSTGNSQYVLANEIPIEVRVYQQAGAGMPWHSDDVCYDPPQIEAILTLVNDSDCETCWKLNPRTTHGKADVHCEWTAPNSVLLLRAGDQGPSHCVTSLKRGQRVIVKCAFALSDARYLGQSSAQPQFASRRTRS